MHALARTAKNNVAVLSGKSTEYGGFCLDGKRQVGHFGREREIANGREAFATSIDLQMLQLQPRELSPEISCSGYGEVEAGVADGGYVAVRIRKGERTTICHLPCPVAPADGSCDRLKCRTDGHRIGWLETF